MELVGQLSKLSFYIDTSNQLKYFTCYFVYFPFIYYRGRMLFLWLSYSLDSDSLLFVSSYSGTCHLLPPFSELLCNLCGRQFCIAALDILQWGSHC
jgi:hypothetical protein